MDEERQRLTEELERLEPSTRAREIYLRKDNAGLARVIARMKEDHELARRVGHINATGLWLKTEDGRTVIKYSPELD